MSSGDVSMESILKLCSSAKDSNSNLYCHLNTYLTSVRNEPIVPLLTLAEPNTRSLDELFLKIEKDAIPEATAHLLQAIMQAEVAPTFYKINVHAALTPAEIKKHFDPVLDQAKLLEKMEQLKVERLIGSPGKRRDSTSFSVCWNNSLSTIADKCHTPVVTVSVVNGQTLVYILRFRALEVGLP